MASECLGSSVKDVQAALANLPEVGSVLVADCGNVFKTHAYMHTDDNNSGWQNHFQGCQRLNDVPYLVFSGSDWRHRNSHLYVAEFDSRPADGRLGSNGTVDVGAVEIKGRVVARVDVDSAHWHAGGLDICENYLVVPVECGHKSWLSRLMLKIAQGVSWPKCPNGRDSSLVRVFDMSNPQKPVATAPALKRDGRTATAAALTRLLSSHYLLAVLSTEKEKGQHKGSKRLDFHVSNTTNISDGFAKESTQWWDDMLPGGKRFGGYQCINFVCDESGALFLVGMYNPGTGPPLASAPDVVDLFRVALTNAASPPPTSPACRVALSGITPVGALGTEHFKDPRSSFNFHAGAGLYVNENALYLYSVHHFRSSDGLIPLAEFAT